MTSFTRTDKARYPGRMTGARPDPASFEASLFGRIASFCTTGWIRPRPTTSSTCSKAPTVTAKASTMKMRMRFISRASSLSLVFVAHRCRRGHREVTTQRRAADNEFRDAVQDHEVIGKIHGDLRAARRSRAVRDGGVALNGDRRGHAR